MIETKGNAHRVVFDRAGRFYGTLWTRNRLEAEAWAHNTSIHGWPMEGRPLPVELREASEAVSSQPA